LLRRELAAMKVRRNHPRFSFGKRAFPPDEVINAEGVATSLRSSVAVTAIQDHSLIEADWLKYPLRSDVAL
jgi:hypothetical protein